MWSAGACPMSRVDPLLIPPSQLRVESQLSADAREVEPLLLRQSAFAILHLLEQDIDLPPPLLGPRRISRSHAVQGGDRQIEPSRIVLLLELPHQSGGFLSGQGIGFFHLRR